MKRINPKTNQPFKYGDVRDDGFIFIRYRKILKKDGFYQESWNSPEANQKRLKKLNERMSKNWVKYNPEYHIKRINPDTGVFFKPGDRDKDGRYFLNYYGGAHYGSKKIPERWAKTEKDYIKRAMSKSLSKIRERCKKRNVPFNLDINYLMNIYPDNGMCPALKIKMMFGGDKANRYNSPSVDRIIPKKGYIKGNVRFVSFLANAIMNDANADEILKVGNWLKAQDIIRHKDR